MITNIDRLKTGLKLDSFIKIRISNTPDSMAIPAIT